MLKKKPEISEFKDVAHVWFCTFSKNESKLPEFEAHLSDDEKKRAANFKFKKDRIGYIISRGILRVLLGNYLDVSPKEIKFEYTSFGKPFLRNNTLNFNVTHSANMAAFAFILNSEIGVDLERIKEDFDVLELARNFFSKKEVELIKKVPEEQLIRTFYRCWTRKESFIKAVGSGLSFPLDRFTVSMDNDYRAILFETDWNASEKLNWSLFSFVPKNNYIGALAVRNRIATCKYFNFDDAQVE